MPDHITVNLVNVALVVYVIGKACASIWITKREFGYPIWDGDGVQISRGIQHKLRSFFRNWLINPEWGLMKAVAFAPVFLVTGRRYIHYFLPWRVQNPPPFCKKCDDKGKIWISGFFVGQSGHWEKCSCKDQQLPRELPDAQCVVCLDKGSIGKNRPCPHCQRRTRITNIAQTGGTVVNQTEPQWAKLNQCAHCGAMTHGTQSWCSVCVQREVRRELCESPNSWRYLHKPDPCCGSIDAMKIKERSPYQMEKIPQHFYVGEAVMITACPSGHRAQHLLGKPLRILGINLPHLVVEYDSASVYDGMKPSRHIDSIDVRGMTFSVGKNNCSIPPIFNNLFRPLLDPEKLNIGDKFAVINIKEGGTDGSYIGQAFEVVHPAMWYSDRNRSLYHDKYGTREDSRVIGVRHLSYVHYDSLTLLQCEGLQIIPVSDAYVLATKTHCPDTGVL